MELLVSAYYNVDELAGKPTEYEPSVAIWTTDPEQAQTVSPGKAVDHIPMDTKGNTIRPTSFTNKGGLFPIKDLTADLCVALYTKTQSDGSTPDAGKNRPFTIAAGQISIPWSVIVRFLISNGNAYLTKNPQDEEATAKRSFPTATVVQQLSSLVVAEGVAYEIQLRQQSGDKSPISAELKRLGPDSLSKKGELKIMATLLAVSDKAASMSLRKRLDITERYYVASAPGFRDRKDKEERLKLGHIHASDMVKASQNYDKLSSAENKAFTAAMTRYRQFYESLWLASGERSGKKLAIFDTTGEKTILFKPDVPSVARFHLPLWVNGNDLIPYAEWWLRTLPEHTTHMPKATEMTEQFLSTLAVMAFKRIDIEPKKFVKVIGQLSHRAADIPSTKLQRFLVVGSKQRNNFIKCAELVFYTVMMVAHAIRYSGDGRYVKILAQYLRLDIESPQHDTISGTADDADCEDMATVIAILVSLLILGRLGGDSKSGGRGWFDPVLSMMRRVLQMYCDFNIFGSVKGRQLSDADEGGDGKSKEAANEDDEGIIGSVEDVREDIGGHSFVIHKSLPEVAERYEKAGHIIDTIVGFSVNERIKKFVMGILRGWIGEVSTVTTSPVTEQLYAIWKSAPSTVLEGTGRQEPMLMSLEHYFGLGTEFLQRVARHASEIDVLERWPKETQPEKKKHHHHSHSNYSSDQDKVKSQAIQSMGEASPYMFQKRLTIRSMTKNGSQRHVSAFYRRVVHSVSSRLHVIMPETFVHLVWVDPDRLTYGPTLRSAIEVSGHAIPIPLNPKLHQQYLTEYASEAKDAEILVNGNTFATDLFSKRMRRIIPFDLSFQHLGTTPQPTTEVISPVASNATLWSDAAKARKAQTEEAIPQVYELSHSNHSKQHEDFFCKSQFEIHDPRDISSPVNSAGQYALFSQPRQPNDALVLTVPSDSAVANAIRNVAGPDTKALLVPNVRSCMVTRPMNGVVQPIGSNSLANHVNSGAGVKQTRVYSERIFPWLSDNLCAHFSRDVKFIIDDNIKASSPNNIPVTSRARSGNNVPVRLDERHEETLAYMRFDVNQAH